MSLALLLQIPIALGGAALLGVAAPPPIAAPAAVLPRTGIGTELRLAPAAFGRSGALRAVILDPSAELRLPLVWSDAAPGPLQYRWTRAAGTQPAGPRLLGAPAEGAWIPSATIYAPLQRGVWRLGLRAGDWSREVTELAVFTRVPFAEKRDGYLNGYHIGTYETEGSGRFDRYAPPGGFVEVTPENQDVPLSEHFRLRNFLTKDQFDVWPKYVALDLRLLDKLELVLQELRQMGIRADAMSVMSGYRTPQYNGPGDDGRARLSRHTYGDASDVWVDNDGNGYIDDLNGDGLCDVADARLLLRAVDRVEERYPELTGGAGAYLPNEAHGPFVHIDVRGARSRW